MANPVPAYLRGDHSLSKIVTYTLKQADMEALRGQLRTETSSFLMQSRDFQCAWSLEVRPLRTQYLLE